MRRNALGSFLGTTPRGEDWKLGKGGEEKGPAMRPRASSLVSFLETMSRWAEADG